MPRLFVLLMLVSAAGAQISFGPSREMTDAISAGIAQAKATDMDGDGDLDAVVAENYTVRVLWWENDGAGNFTKRPEWTWGDLNGEVIGLEDWNGDGRVDVWIHVDAIFEGGDSDEFPRSFHVAVNQGDGSFAAPVPVGDHVTLSSSGMESFVADMNGDGRNDLVTRDGVYHADAAGVFPGPPVALAESLWDEPHQVTPFDAGGDGDTDLLTFGFYTEHRLLFVQNLGPAGFAAPVALLTPDEDTVYGGHCVVASGAGLQVLVIEAESGGNAPTLRSFVIAADGMLTLQASLPLPAMVDGREAQWQALRATPQGRVFVLSFGVLPGYGPGQAPFTKVHEVTWDGSSLGLVGIASHPGVLEEWRPDTLDLNGDTLPDLFLPLASVGGVEGSTPDQIVWHAGTSSGGFAAAGHDLVCGEGNLKLHRVSDMDGDGDTDVLAGNTSLLGYSDRGTDRLELWRNTGGGGNFERSSIPHGRDRIDVIGVMDVTGPAGSWHPEDPNQGAGWPGGRLDILVQTRGFASDTTRIEWFLQSDDGVFHRWTAGSAGDSDMAPVEWVDWDGDGTRDLVFWRTENQGYILIDWMKGEGYAFAANATLAVLPFLNEFSPAFTADLDRDGDLDLVAKGFMFANKPGYWLENDGTGAIESIRGLPHALELAPDLDGDGHVDFTTTGHVLLARPGLGFEVRPLSAIPPPGHPRGCFSDVDEDGDLDFFGALATAGVSNYPEIRWWENRGDARFSPPDGIPAAPPRWALRDQMKTGDMDGDLLPDLVVASSSSPRLEWFRVVRAFEAQAFSGWMGNAGLAGHSAGPGGDWDADGIANWDEFAFGSDPAANDPFHPGRPHLETTAQEMLFNFHRRTDAAAAGLTYPLERTTDLVDWDDWTPLLESTPAAEGYEKIVIPLEANQPKEFFRVAVPDSP